MKKFMTEFCKRGLVAAAGGPVVLGIVYGILGATGVIDHLSPGTVCLGILTVTVLAFISAGITAVYTVEQLPLGWAIGLHGIVLYADYILIYLLNGWLKHQVIPVLIFTAVFVTGYALIWLIIYLFTKAHTDSINRKLKANQA